MSKKTKNLNLIAHQYAGLVNTDTNRGIIIKMAIAFFSLQIIGIGINTIQTSILNQDPFKIKWETICSDNFGKWLNLGMVVSLIILLMYIMETRMLSHEAKRFAELTIKRYAHTFNIDIYNLNTQDFCDIADLVLSHIPKDKSAQILEKCVALREELYVAEMQCLKNEITQKQYNNIYKTCLVEMTNYTTPIIQTTIKNNPALGELIQNIINGKAKYTPTKMFKNHQK